MDGGATIDRGGPTIDGATPMDSGWALVNAPDNPFPCLNPMPAADWGTGFMRCDNGLVFRPVPVTCPASMDERPDECFGDADCEKGYCGCGIGTAFSNNSCFGWREAECRSDRDCATGFHCAVGYAGESDATFLYTRCQKPLDECVREEDCIEDGEDAGTSSGTGPACQARADHRECCTVGNGCIEP